MAEICLFVAVANTKHLLGNPVLTAQHCNRPVTAADCRLVKIAAIAAALELDSNIVRRKTAVLRADGRCLVTRRGVIMLHSDAGSALFSAAPGELSTQPALLADLLQALILDNGYNRAVTEQLPE